ncbi:IS1 family transposase [Sorangium sp. So ce1014]|uniref:IS1 family transposase n=1 Tax=Sorangium sp. So ce1014 TaxID=3133326 RepID=UPI003F603C81
MANMLSAERRLEVLAALVNGTSIRAASRMTGVHQDTIGRFAQAIGEGCARLHDRMVRDLTSPLVDIDEMHSWCGRRQIHVDPTKHDAATSGEQWTWAAICRTSKLIIAWHVGKRDQESADALVEDVRARLVVMPQITTDGLGLYAQPIAANFGRAVPYMQTVKNFSARPGKPGTSETFAVARGVDFIQKRAVFGTPDPAKATNYAIERSNLTARQWNARLRRRTLAFSKKVTRHRAAIALHYVYVNLCHIPRNVRITPAMAAGITDTVWTLEQLKVAALAEPAGEKPEPQPLTIPKPEGAARELPAGRGWLRVVDGGSPGATPTPQPPPQVPSTAPATPPPAPVPAAAVPETPAAVEPAAALTEPSRQLDLFAWRPKPRTLVQLSLFGDPPIEPAKG